MITAWWDNEMTWERKQFLCTAGSYICSYFLLKDFVIAVFAKPDSVPHLAWNLHCAKFLPYSTSTSLIPHGQDAKWRWTWFVGWSEDARHRNRNLEDKTAVDMVSAGKMWVLAPQQRDYSSNPVSSRLPRNVWTDSVVVICQCCPLIAWACSSL